MTPPEVSGLPEPRMIDSKGVRLALYDKGEGTPVVFSHGFPELAYSWRHQIDAVAEAGFRALAPDQRGYGLSDRPTRVEDYDIRQLTDDLVAVLDDVGKEKGIFCGHDWGGIVGWAMPLLHPDRTAGVIGVNTPFLPRSPVPPLGLIRATFGDNHYIAHFQKPGEADIAFASDVDRVFRRLMRKGIRVEDIDLSRPMRNMVEIVQDDEDDVGVPAITESERAVYVEAFERSGFTGPINWYRNLDRNWELLADAPQKVEAPALMITAELDFALPPVMAQGMEAYVPDLEKHQIADCGHWTQVEKPEELNRLLVDWLRRRFGGSPTA